MKGVGHGTNTDFMSNEEEKDWCVCVYLKDRLMWILEIKAELVLPPTVVKSPHGLHFPLLFPPFVLPTFSWFGSSALSFVFSVASLHPTQTLHTLLALIHSFLQKVKGKFTLQHSNIPWVSQELFIIILLYLCANSFFFFFFTRMPFDCSFATLNALL